VGGEVFEGAATTTAVCAEVAAAEPALFEAVTTTRIVEPRSAEVTVYVCAANGTMSAQAPPEPSQRRH
jgi:hypothetical protein